MLINESVLRELGDVYGPVKSAQYRFSCFLLSLMMNGPKKAVPVNVNGGAWHIQLGGTFALLHV